jgi:hypothetical protein
MPLSPPAPREPLHTRRVECRGYRREDGLWDIEGHLVDTKSYAFENRHRGPIQPGEALHGMWIRLTLDDDLKVHRVEAVTDASPFAICGDIVGNYRRLEGLSIGPGWTRKVKELLGGVEGCTHLVELLGPVATTAFQTIFSERERRARLAAAAESPKTGGAPRLVDTCHAFRADGPIVKEQWPDAYTGA